MNLKNANAVIDNFLARCAPAPLPKEETLRRYMMQLDALHGIAVKAAEEKMPGWSEQVLRISKKIEELQGTVGVGGGL